MSPNTSLFFELQNNFPLQFSTYFQCITESTARKTDLRRRSLPQLLEPLSFPPHLLLLHHLPPRTSHLPRPPRSCAWCSLGDLDQGKAQLATPSWGGRSLNRVQKASRPSLGSARKRKRRWKADGYVAQQMFCVKSNATKDSTVLPHSTIGRSIQRAFFALLPAGGGSRYPRLV